MTRRTTVTDASGQRHTADDLIPSDISQFSGIDFASPVAETESEAVLHVPEDTVKRAFAGLIGESYVPKDWGGERSDLYTSRVFARGRQVSAAWLFKKPDPHGSDVVSGSRRLALRWLLL